MAEEFVNEPIVTTETPSVPAATVATETPAAGTPNADQTQTTPDPAVPAAPAHTEGITIPGIKYGDSVVTVDIPADILNFTAEKGIDAESVAKELYSETGLTETTKQSLYDAFGKWQVDTYLDALDTKNKATVGGFKAKAEAEKVAAEEAWTQTLDLMGGEDRWTDLDSYAVKNLSDDELNEFNEVMKSGSMRMQKLMIADLWGRFSEAGKPVAPAVLDLEAADNIPPSSSSSAITSEEYFAAFKSGEYRKDPKGWDAKRSEGIKKGI
jgi:hypothetical protein